LGVQVFAKVHFAQDPLSSKPIAQIRLYYLDQSRLSPIPAY